MTSTKHGYNRSTENRLPTKFLKYEEQGDVAFITLNRPKVMNALSVDLSREFLETVEYIRDRKTFTS